MNNKELVRWAAIISALAGIASIAVVVWALFQ